ncbi:MAG: NifX-associated nitrogen fixation protein [Hyphomicrobiaceae bacterium]|nr:NifX-associated nitrogen fixation protein [Hyphomicrobiaceae bacterium]
MTTGTLHIDISDPGLSSEIVEEIVRQMRAIDTYGTYDNSDDVEIIDPFILTKERRREIPIVGDPDEITLARLKAYYNAVSVMIEKRTGLMAAPVVNLSYEGFGHVFVVVGKLVTVDRTLRDVHRFGFASLQDLQNEVDKLIDKAVVLIEAHRDVATL